MDITVEVPLSDDLAVRLEQKARTAGMDRQQYIRALLTRDLNDAARLDDALRSFREEVASSGMSDEELEDLFRDARADRAAE